MNVNDIVKLVNAGFTKEDIVKLSSAQAPAQPAQPEEPAKLEEVKGDAPEQPEQPKDSAEVISAAITKALEPFQELYTNMVKLAGMPSMENIEPKGIDDIIDNFFKGE